MIVEIIDPSGRLPPAALKLLPAYFAAGMDMAEAARMAGMDEGHARALFALPDVKPVARGIVTAILDHVASNGQSLIGPDDDAITGYLLEDAGDRAHEDWILSGDLDEPAKSGI